MIAVIATVTTLLKRLQDELGMVVYRVSHSPTLAVTHPRSMSQSSAQDLSDSLWLQCDIWHMVAITILYWDHVLTFKTEYKCLWKRPSNISGYLFFLNRYFNALAVLLVMISIFHTELHLSCRQLSQFREALLIIAQLIVVVILTLRVYALYGCSRRLLYFMLSVIAVLLGVVMFSTYYPGEGEHETLSGRCITQFDFKASTRKAIAWQMLLIYDTLLFGLALHNAFKTRQELKTLRMLRNRASLKVILLRDGAMYFGAMALANLVNILTYYTLEGCMRGGLAAVASSLSVTLISRMMLNLHVVMDTGIYLSQFSSQVDEQQETRIVFYERRPVRDSFDV